VIEQAVVYKTLRTVESRMRFPLVGACVYEAVALAFPSKYTPPVSELAHRHKWVFPLFSAALGAHIWFYDEDASARVR
jgi:hypothetical protein